jgi:hypothetical protein
MRFLTYLKEGFGNRFLMLIGVISQFSRQRVDDDVLYVLEVFSRHDLKTEDERMETIFPKLKELPWLKFLKSWKEYDQVSQTAHVVDPTFDFKPEMFSGMSSFLKKWFVFRPDYKSLLKEIDAKKGILLHYRLGDKAKNMNSYLVMKPEYFTDNASRMLEKQEGPVYLVSDSPALAKKLIPDATFLDLSWMETFYLITKFKRSVLSESTFGVAATSLNFGEHETVFPEYHVQIKSSKLVLFSWGPMFKYETNKKYRARLKADLTYI